MKINLSHAAERISELFGGSRNVRLILSILDDDPELIKAGENLDVSLTNASAAHREVDRLQHRVNTLMARWMNDCAYFRGRLNLMLQENVALRAAVVDRQRWVETMCGKYIVEHLLPIPAPVTDDQLATLDHSCCVHGVALTDDCNKCESNSNETSRFQLSINRENSAMLGLHDGVQAAYDSCVHGLSSDYICPTCEPATFQGTTSISYEGMRMRAQGLLGIGLDSENWMRTCESVNAG
jgi:hypothetical protein